MSEEHWSVSDLWLESVSLGVAGGWLLAAWVLLTDAWHLDDLHRSGPKCRRTELSPDEYIFQRKRSGLGYK